MPRYFAILLLGTLAVFAVSYQSCQNADMANLFSRQNTATEFSGGNGQGYEGKLEVTTVAFGELNDGNPFGDYYRIRPTVTCGNGLNSHSGLVRFLGATAQYQVDSCSTWQPLTTLFDYSPFDSDYLSFQNQIFQKYSVPPPLEKAEKENFLLCRRKINQLEGLDVILANNKVTAASSQKNLLQDTERFDGKPWTYDSYAVRDVAAAPNGFWTADKFRDAPASLGSAMRTSGQSLRLADNTIYTFSIYAKAAERNWLILRSRAKDSGVLDTFFDLQNGVMGRRLNQDATIEPAADGWYRLQITFDSRAGAENPYISMILSADGNTRSYIGDGTSGLYLWGAQVELGAQATAYERVQTADGLGSPTLATVRYSSADAEGKLMRRGSEAVDLQFDSVANHYVAPARQFSLKYTEPNKMQLDVTMDGSEQSYLLDCLSDR